MMKPQWTEAVQAVRDAERILLVTHVSPDGDALGSMLGLGNALRQMGKNITCAVDDGVPAGLAFLPGSEGVLGALENGEWDLMISTDASDEERTGRCGQWGRAHSRLVINLDHHITNTLFGDIMLVDPEAAAAAEIAYHWLLKFPLTVDRDAALPLLTGLVTDTRSFSTSSVRGETLLIAESLMRTGVSLSDVVARALDARPYSSIELWKRALPTTRLEGRVIWAAVHYQDVQEVGLTGATDAGLVNLLVTVEEALVAAVFKELADGRVELGMRAKPGFDVGSLALSLGGGGHTQAAGTTIDGPLEAACDRVLPLLHEVVRQGKLLIV